GWIGRVAYRDTSWQASPPFPLSIGWRGGQGERWCVRSGLTPVSPLHSMERGPGGTPGHAISDQSTLPGLARRVLAVIVLQAATLTGCWAANYEPSQLVPPKPLREFRGAWVATVGNLDWPSRPGLTTAQQRAELMALLERAVQLKLNVVIFQVRPACDALYASKLEPWSESIT